VLQGSVVYRQYRRSAAAIRQHSAGDRRSPNPFTCMPPAPLTHGLTRGHCPPVLTRSRPVRNRPAVYGVRHGGRDTSAMLPHRTSVRPGRVPATALPLLEPVSLSRASRIAVRTVCLAAPGMARAGLSTRAMPVSRVAPSPASRPELQGRYAVLSLCSARRTAPHSTRCTGKRGNAAGA